MVQFERTGLDIKTILSLVNIPFIFIVTGTLDPSSDLDAYHYRGL